MKEEAILHKSALAHEEDLHSPENLQMLEEVFGESLEARRLKMRIRFLKRKIRLLENPEPNESIDQE